jgi:hypothetical protein
MTAPAPCSGSSAVDRGRSNVPLGLVVAVALWVASFLGWARSARAADGACRADPAQASMKDCDKTSPGLGKMVPDLDILETPGSPALAAVGGAPVDIERPTTATAAAASLASGIVHGLFVPGTTTAIEVMPYWLWRHPRLTADDVEATRDLAFLHDISISFAATPGADPAKPVDTTATTATMTSANAGLVALGARTTIWPGRPSEAAKACMARIDDFMRGDVSLRNQAEAAFRTEWTAAHPMPGRVEVEPAKDLNDDTQVADYQARMKAANEGVAARHIADYRAALEHWLVTWRATHGVPDDVAACGLVINHRVGPIASIAGAALVSAPGGDFSRLRQGGTFAQRAWLTGGYSWLFGDDTPTTFSLLGALRVRRQRVLGDAGSHIVAGDYGARVVNAFGQWGLSLQAMRLGEGANGVGSGQSWQGGVAVDYHLQTGYWLTATAGSTDIGSITSWTAATVLVSLQYNVGRDRLILPDASPSEPPGGVAP